MLHSKLDSKPYPHTLGKVGWRVLQGTNILAYY